MPGVRGARGQAISAAELTLFDVTVEFLSSVVAADSLDLHGGGLRGGRWSLNLERPPPGAAPGRGGVHARHARQRGGSRAWGRAASAPACGCPGRAPRDGVLRIGRKWITGRLAGKRVRTRAPGATASARGPGLDR